MSLVNQIKNFVESTGFEMSHYMQDTQEVLVPNDQLSILDQQTIDSLLDMSTAFGGIRFYLKKLYNSSTEESRSVFYERSLYEYIKSKKSFNMNNTFLSDEEVLDLAGGMKVEYSNVLINSLNETGSESSDLSKKVYEIVLQKTY